MPFRSPVLARQSNDNMMKTSSQTLRHRAAAWLAATLACAAISHGGMGAIGKRRWEFQVEGNNQVKENN
jgi:hypothetical protein